MTTHATRLREIAGTISRSFPGTALDLRDIATALEAAPDTAALEAKLAEWREVGQRAKTVLSTCHTRLHDDLTALLAKPDPLVGPVSEVLKPYSRWLDDDDILHIAAELRKRGIELGSAK